MISNFNHKETSKAFKNCKKSGGLEKLYRSFMGEVENGWSGKWTHKDFFIVQQERGSALFFPCIPVK